MKTLYRVEVGAWIGEGRVPVTRRYDLYARSEADAGWAAAHNDRDKHPDNPAIDLLSVTIIDRAVYPPAGG